MFFITVIFDFIEESLLSTEDILVSTPETFSSIEETFWSVEETFSSIEETFPSKEFICVSISDTCVSSVSSLSKLPIVWGAWETCATNKEVLSSATKIRVYFMISPL